MVDTIRIATRESALAMWQANHVKSMLERAHPGVAFEICGMTTEGDRNKSSPLSQIGGKGLFVKELEIALMDGRADIAVHSMKDVPAVLPEGLGIHAICEREDPRDAFVSNAFDRFESLPDGARVGTSSLRRRLQIKSWFPTLSYPDLRGNVDTRLRKLDDGEYDAIILATAGLKRLGLAERITTRIEPNVCLPSAGQGAVGIECRDDARDVIDLISAVDHGDTSLRVHAERTISSGLGATCTLPIAAYAELDDATISLAAFVSDEGGRRVIRTTKSSARADAMVTARAVVDELLDQGALDLIAAE